ncbi:MAG: hypothetical protein NVV73_11320 [Cellvibrionaceae bacterium]|nr:hypothetical protein [Cellvibrionaceae bacterium]
MKIQAFMSALALSAVVCQAAAEPPQAYINENFGFNVKGYSYNQSEFPCDIDKNLVALLLERGNKQGLRLEAARTADKLRNGTIPVIAIDVEQLVLGSKEHTYGAEPHSTLPKVQVTAAVIKGHELVTAKHTCAIATLNQLTPSSNVLDLGTSSTVCSVTRRCLRDLSKDIIDWAAPQLN